MGTWDFAVSNNRPIIATSFLLCGLMLARPALVAGAEPTVPKASLNAHAKAPSIYDVEGKWTNQDGLPFNWSDKRFEWTVLSMVYTSCQSSCPLITQKMQLLEKKLPPTSSSKVRFLLFSFDSKRDFGAALKIFAEKHHLDMSRWSLLTASDEESRTLATALDFRFKKLENWEFSHSNQITLLNAAGTIVSQTSNLADAPQTLLAVIVGGRDK